MRKLLVFFLEKRTAKNQNKWKQKYILDIHAIYISITILRIKNCSSEWLLSEPKHAILSAISFYFVNIAIDVYSTNFGGHVVTVVL